MSVDIEVYDASIIWDGPLPRDRDSLVIDGLRAISENDWTLGTNPEGFHMYFGEWGEPEHVQLETYFDPRFGETKVDVQTRLDRYTAEGADVCVNRVFQFALRTPPSSRAVLDASTYCRVLDSRGAKHVLHVWIKAPRGSLPEPRVRNDPSSTIPA